MDITHTIDATCRLSLGYTEAGELSVKVFGQADYAPGRSTTAEVSGSELSSAVRQQLEAAARAALDEASPKLGPRLMQAIVKSTEVAASMGELS